MKKLILFSLSLLFIPLVAGASFDTNLYYGLRNNSDVKELQEFLLDKGFYTGNATGNFLSITLKSVKAYQRSIGLSGTGYVGILTRTAINDELAIELSESNTESTAETGTTPPTPTPQATTNDVIIALQAQIALLLQQVQAMQAQQTTVQQLQQTVQQQTQTIQQIQQNTQQIVQNTCSPNWQCNTWSTCADSSQTRTCNDTNNCGVLNNKPTETQFCMMPILGCMDKTAKNYNSNAQKDNGSCIAWTKGCTDKVANNYNPNADWNEGCVYPPKLSFQSRTNDSVLMLGTDTLVGSFTAIADTMNFNYSRITVRFNGDGFVDGSTHGKDKNVYLRVDGSLIKTVKYDFNSGGNLVFDNLDLTFNNNITKIINISADTMDFMGDNERGQRGIQTVISYKYFNGSEGYGAKFRY